MRRFTTTREDGTLEQSKLAFSWPAYLGLEGYTSGSYTEPGEDYRQWLQEMARQAGQKAPKNALDIVAAAKTYQHTEVMTVDFLAERWDVPWQLLRSGIESGHIAYRMMPLIIGVHERKGSVRYGYKLVIPLEEVLRLENEHPELARLALEHADRLERKKQQESKRLEAQQNRLLARLKKTISERKLTLEDAIQILAAYTGKEESDGRSEKGGGSDQTSPEATSIVAVMQRLRAAGKSEAEIAVLLKEHGLSFSQIGVLLHPAPLQASRETLISYAKRLLHRASKTNK